MKSNSFAGWTIGVAALVASAGFTAVVVSDAMAGSDTERATDAGVGDVDELQQVLTALREAGYTRVLEIEREHDGYEVEALTAGGRRVELLVDGKGALQPRDGHDDDRRDDDDAGVRDD